MLLGGLGARVLGLGLSRGKGRGPRADLGFGTLVLLIEGCARARVSMGWDGCARV